MKEKIFELWHRLKQFLSEKKSEKNIFFHEREIWFCHLGKNIGFEQDGKGEEFLRPVLVIKKFNQQVAWIIPTTTQEKTGKFYHKISKLIGGKTDYLILSQIKLIDQRRLKYKLDKINKNEFAEIIQKIKNLFPL